MPQIEGVLIEKNFFSNLSNSLKFKAPFLSFIFDIELISSGTKEIVFTSKKVTIKDKSVVSNMYLNPSP